MQKLFSNSKKESLIVDVGVDGIKPRYEYSFSMCNLLVALLLKFQKDIVPDIIQLNDVKMLHNLAHLIEYFLTKENCNAEQLIDSINNAEISESTVQFLLHPFGGSLEYTNYLGTQKISFDGHTAYELQVLKEFLLLQLRSTTSTNWLTQEVTWVQDWDLICEEWEPSFLVGFIVNIPTCLNTPSSLSVIDYKNELPLHIS